MPDGKRMPLILNGARQVGKSYILEELGKSEFDDFIRIDLERSDSVRSFFNSDIEPAHIIQYLEAAYNKRILAGRTLVVLDEIQSCRRALLSLKSFCEDAPQYHIAAAGSLLGVALAQEKDEMTQELSYPVGKVSELQMFPMDFEEFLWANGKKILAVQIRQCYSSNEALPSAIHDLAVALYKQYLVVGGMPAAVQEFVETSSLIAAADLQGTVAEEYSKDMSKYADAATSVRIRACYNSIPAQLAKENRKFQYRMVKSGATSSYFGEAINWLEQSGVVLKCSKTEQGSIPLKAYTDLSDFKLYMSDIGMLTKTSGMPIQMIVAPSNEFSTFGGAIAENYVAQALASNGHPLYYWRNGNTAEVDFVIQQDDNVVPIEVKSGIRVQSKSLNIFIKGYSCKTAIRLSLRNFGCDGIIKSVPLYAAFCI